MLPTGRSLRSRIGASFELHKLLLILAAVAPFIPAAWQFVERGVPDHLFTGDGAVLELRTRHAAEGAQLLGPYSRFIWSHPGPLFFYLALPVYEAFGERGPALNLFMLLANTAIAIAIVLTARRLRGNSFAWIVAALLSVFEMIAMPSVRTGEWNPIAPLLALFLLSLLTARLALGSFGLLSVFAFLASAIVQTHVGFLPVVATLAALVLMWNAGRFALGATPPPALPKAGHATVTAIVLAACWVLPAYESLTREPANLRLLGEFFSQPDSSPPSWEVVFKTLCAQLAVAPITTIRALYVYIPPPGPLFLPTVALVQFGVVLVAAGAAWKRRDPTLGVLAAIAIAETIASTAALRSIRGDLWPHLVVWIWIPSFVTCATAATFLVGEGARRGIVALGAGITVVALTLTSGGSSTPAFRPADDVAEQFARNVADAILTRPIDLPVIRIASADAWPMAAGVVLYLHKRAIPFYVEPSWGFMFGPRLVDTAGTRPRLLIGNRTLDEQARTDPHLSLLTASGSVAAYLEPAGVWARDRRAHPPTIVSFVEIDGDPLLAVDGIVPVEGTSWNAPQSVVFRSMRSSLTVSGTRDDQVNGLFVSVDGNDSYTVRCLGANLSWELGVKHPEEGLTGLQVRRVHSEHMRRCEGVSIAPSAGDGQYSIAEVGFLR